MRSVKKTVTVVREIQFDVEVTFEEVEDGDGLGDYGSTGNSMTGSRGRSWVAVDFEINELEVASEALSQLSEDDTEFLEEAEGI